MPVNVLTMVASEGNSAALPVRPGTKVDIPFHLKHSSLLPETNPAMMQASTRASPLCTTAMAPLRSITCVLRMEVQLDPKLKGEPLRIWTPVIFIPRYEPRAAFKKFDQKLLPKETPQIAARAIHRPDMTLAIGPMFKSDSEPKYFTVPLTAAAPIILPSESLDSVAAPVDALAGRVFQLAPLATSEPDMPNAELMASTVTNSSPRVAQEEPQGDSDDSASADESPTSTSIPGPLSSSPPANDPVASPSKSSSSRPRSRSRRHRKSSHHHSASKSRKHSASAPVPQLSLQPQAQPVAQMYLPGDLLIDFSSPHEEYDVSTSSNSLSMWNAPTEVPNPFVDAFSAPLLSSSSTPLAASWKNPFLVDDSPRKESRAEDSSSINDSDSSDIDEDSTNGEPSWFDK